MYETETKPASPAEFMQRAAEGTLSDLLGIEVIDAAPGRVTARVTARPDLLGPTGIVHGGTIVTLADTIAGMGCVASFPAHARGFTTVELKVNFLRAATVGATLLCEARQVHGGRTTQVWDATVTREDGEVIALYRCTQLLLGDRLAPVAIPADSFGP